MIKLYKNAEKNEKIKAVIADLRKTSRPFSFKYYHMTERISWIMSHYNLESWEMARKNHMDLNRRLCKTDADLRNDWNGLCNVRSFKLLGIKRRKGENKI